MNTAPPTMEEQAPGHAPVDNYIKHGKGLGSWFVTLDHKRIGVLYIISIMTSFFLGGVFALLVRIELLTAKQTIVDADTYNQLFTLHGAVMIFLFVSAYIVSGPLGELVRLLRGQQKKTLESEKHVDGHDAHGEDPREARGEGNG